MRQKINEKGKTVSRRDLKKIKGKTVSRREAQDRAMLGWSAERGLAARPRWSAEGDAGGSSGFFHVVPSRLR